jgi:uncharacterized surface protein with fasciclin (FAS1) repeats
VAWLHKPPATPFNHQPLHSPSSSLTILSTHASIPQELLTTVLSYHLIPGEVLTSDQLEADLVLQTSLGGQAGEIRVRRMGGRVAQATRSHALTGGWPTGWQ